jgi:hypothetical protein
MPLCRECLGRKLGALVRYSRLCIHLVSLLGTRSYGLSVVKVAAQHFGGLVLIEEGPYRLEGRGLRSEFILPLVLNSRRGLEGLEDVVGEDERASLCQEYGSGRNSNLIIS